MSQDDEEGWMNRRLGVGQGDEDEDEDEGGVQN